MNSTATRIEGLAQAKVAGVGNLFEPVVVIEVNTRLSQLRSESERRWGKMYPAQMLARCSAAMKMALGEVHPRDFPGRILGPLAKRWIIRKGKPLRRNSEPPQSIVVSDDREFEAERQRLRGLIDRFAQGGPAGCATQPHWFFGSLTAVEWAVLMYRHLDHHLGQFGV